MNYGPGYNGQQMSNAAVSFPLIGDPRATNAGSSPWNVSGGAQQAQLQRQPVGWKIGQPTSISQSNFAPASYNGNVQQQNYPPNNQPGFPPNAPPPDASSSSRKFHRNHHYYHQSNIFGDYSTPPGPGVRQDINPNYIQPVPNQIPPFGMNSNYYPSAQSNKTADYQSAIPATPQQCNPNRTEKLSKQELFKRELDEQIALKRQRQERERSRDRALDAKEQKESESYNPFGRGGAGAPLRDASGHVVADLRHNHLGHTTATNAANGSAQGVNPTQSQLVSHSQTNTGIQPSSSFMPGVVQQQPQQFAPSYYSRQSNNSVQPLIQSPSPIQGESKQFGHPTGNGDGGEGNVERFTRFQFDRAPPEVQERIQQRLNKQLEFQQTLQAQLDEKKNRKQMERERELMEEKREEDRIAKEREEMQRAYNREHGKPNAGGATTLKVDNQVLTMKASGNGDQQAVDRVLTTSQLNSKSNIPEQQQFVSQQIKAVGNETLERKLASQAAELQRLELALDRSRKECERWRMLAQQRQQSTVPISQLNSSELLPNNHISIDGSIRNGKGLESSTVFVPAQSAPINAVLAGSRGVSVGSGANTQHHTNSKTTNSQGALATNWNLNSGEETDQLDRLLRDFVQQNVDHR